MGLWAHSFLQSQKLQILFHYHKVYLDQADRFSPASAHDSYSLDENIVNEEDEYAFRAKKSSHKSTGPVQDLTQQPTNYDGHFNIFQSEIIKPSLVIFKNYLFIRVFRL